VIHDLESDFRGPIRPARVPWCFGSEEFRAELVRRIEGGLGEHHSGALHLESSRARAEPIVAGELARFGWTELDLAARRKNAPEKLAIAARLRKETTLTVKDLFSRPRIVPAIVSSAGNRIEALLGTVTERPHRGTQWRRTWDVKSPRESFWERRKAPTENCIALWRTPVKRTCHPCRQTHSEYESERTKVWADPGYVQRARGIDKRSGLQC
jgi:hypothetical protein